MAEVGCRYSQEVTVLPSMCDGRSRLSIPAAFDMFQDMATLHANHFEIGPAGMNRRNYFWVITKTSMRIHRMPSMMDNVTALTWIQPADRAKCERDFALCDGDECLIELRSIWAIVSHDTGRIVPMAEIYPDIEFDKAPPEGIDFCKAGRNFERCEEAGSYAIRSVDIDLGGHMNNVNYIRAMLGCMSSDELEEMNISSIDVQYISQSYEGETLTFLKRDTEAGQTDFGAVREDGKTVFVARLG